MALRAFKPVPNTGAATPGVTPTNVAPVANTNVAAGVGNPAPNANVAAGAATPVTNTQVAPVKQPTAPVHVSAAGAVMQDLNAGILDNIDGMGNTGNYVSMDGSEFLYKSTEARVNYIDLIVNYGKRYYQFVDDSDPDNKVFNNSDTKLADRYKLKFEIHWEEEVTEGEVIEPEFHLPTASAMRFIDYVKELAKAGYGIGQVVTRMTISRQVQKNSTNRYSRAEFTMLGIMNADGTYTEIANGITTVNKK